MVRRSMFLFVPLLQLEVSFNFLQIQHLECTSSKVTLVCICMIALQMSLSHVYIRLWKLKCDAFDNYF